MIRRLKNKVKPKDDDDFLVKDNTIVLFSQGALCLGKAGDCAEAFILYKEATVERIAELTGKTETDERVLRSGFERTVPQCKGQ